MRIFLGLVLATLILGGAYTLTYGLPPALAAMVGANPKVDMAAQTAAKTAANPRQRGGGGGRSNVTTVVTTPLTLQLYESILNAVGTASALRSVDVVANAAGTVAQVNLAANRTVSLPELLTIQAGERNFPILWSIIGAALFVAILAMLTGRRRG